MKHVVLFALAAAVCASAGAQFTRAEDAVTYRQSALHVLEHHFKAIGTMVRGRTPYDARVALEHAELVAAMAKLPMKGFVAGTERLSEKAKPEIWTEQARFREHNDKLVSESARLLVAAKTHNIDQLKAAYAATAQTCKACHDAYRNN